MMRLLQTRKIFALGLTLCLLLSLAPRALAAGAALAVSVDKAEVTAGERVTFTLTLSGEKLSLAQGSFTYDPALLAFAESDGGASDGLITMISAEKGGSDTLTAVIQMDALSAGEAQVNFTLESVLDYNGDAQQTDAVPAAAVHIAAAPPEPAEPPVDYSKAENGVKAENVRDATVMLYIWRSLENVTFPSKYAQTELTYHGETVPALSVPETNAPLLLYLSEANGDNGRFYIYEQEQDVLYPYRTVSSVLRSYILLTPDERVEAPAGFSETTLTIGESEVQAWASEDAQGTVYLLYARNPDDEIGFYVYDPGDQSLQRYAVMPARPLQPTPLPARTPAPAVAATPAPIESDVAPAIAEGVHLTRTQFYILCGAAVLLLLALIVTWIAHGVEKSRRRKRAAERRAAREAAQMNMRGE